jgi:hypothetical protein
MARFVSGGPNHPLMRGTEPLGADRYAAVLRDAFVRSDPDPAWVATPARRLTTLLIDDDALLPHILGCKCPALFGGQHDVHQVARPEDVLPLLDAHADADVILLGGSMSEPRDGLWLPRELLAAGCGIPIVAISPDDDDHTAMVAEGCHDGGGPDAERLEELVYQLLG